MVVPCPFVWMHFSFATCLDLSITATFSDGLNATQYMKLKNLECNVLCLLEALGLVGNRTPSTSNLVNYNSKSI